MKSSFNAGKLVLKSELPWTPTEMWVRVIIYYVVMATFLFLLQLGIGSIIFSIPEISIENKENILYSITGILGFIVTVAFLKFDDSRPLRQIGLFLPDRPLLILIVSVTITPFALLFGFVIEHLSGIINFSQMFQNFISDPITLTLLALFTVLGIGAGEEIMFRGYIQRVLESNLGFWTAGIISSLMFGFLHIFLLITRTTDTLFAMIAVGASATIFGLMFVYAYQRTGRNLLFPILIHGIWDVFIFIFNTEFVYDKAEKVVLEIVSQAVAAVVLIILIYLYTEYFPPLTRRLAGWHEQR